MKLWLGGRAVRSWNSRSETERSCECGGRSLAQRYLPLGGESRDITALCRKNEPTIIQYSRLRDDGLLEEELARLLWRLENKGDVEATVEEALGEKLIHGPLVRLICIVSDHYPSALKVTEESEVGADVELGEFVYF